MSADRDLKELPSQTAGPYVHIGLMPNFCGIDGCWPVDLGTGPLDPRAKGERIEIVGRVIDGAGQPVKDALVELWQAGASGAYAGDDGADPHFSGFARSATDNAAGEYRFATVKPGARAGAAHLTLWIVARGINLGLHTRVYFPEDSASHAGDPVLKRIPDPARRATLIATREGAGRYRLDVRLQGEGETVFLDA